MGKVQKERVLDEDDRGVPHLTYEEDTHTLRHYGGGCPAARARAARTRTSGPAQVATDEYRNNWEAIFGARKRGGGEKPS